MCLEVKATAARPFGLHALGFITKMTCKTLQECNRHATCPVSRSYCKSFDRAIRLQSHCFLEGLVWLKLVTENPGSTYVRVNTCMKLSRILARLGEATLPVY